jgi:diguanylate cyclase (GGDEF)-like protein/PAS domain S-box-containing protein
MILMQSRQHRRDRSVPETDAFGRDVVAAVHHGAVLAGGAGLLTLVNNYIPGSPALNRGLLNAVGGLAVLVGLLLWRVRGERAARRWVVALPLLSFALVGVANVFGRVSPYSYGLYLVVIFAYVGLSHPPLASLAYVPAAAATYVAPLLASPHHSLAAGLPSITVALPVCVLVAEVVARAERRLNLAQAADARSLAALRVSEDRYRALVENVTEVVYAARPDPATGFPVYTFVSSQVEVLLGYRPSEFVERPERWAEVIHPDDLAGVTDTTRLLVEAKRAVKRSYRVRHRVTGEYRWMDDRVVPTVDRAGAVTGYLGVARDVTPEKELEQRLSHEALHDPLTGLANRALLKERLDRALARGEREARPVGVLNLDLDDFKVVNDTWGHAAGDELLVAVAARLTGAVRPGDTVARFGGDEFVVLLEDLAGPGEAAAVADRIVTALAVPFEVQGEPVATRASVGVAVAAAGATAPETILKEADTAMYAAKAAGKGRYEMRSEALLGTPPTPTQ